MKLSTLLLLWCLVSSLASAQTKTANTYYSKEIGWTIQIPAGWTMVTQAKNDENNRVGKDAIKQVYDGDIDTKGLKNLVGFQRNQFNVFGATAEAMKEDYPGEYEANNRQVNNLVYNALVNQGIKVDSSSGTEMIQGLRFNRFNTVIYGTDGDVILRQVLYCRLMKGYDFGVSISYNNEQDKETMMKAWKNSLFKK